VAEILRVVGDRFPAEIPQPIEDPFVDLVDLVVPVSNELTAHL